MSTADSSLADRAFWEQDYLAGVDLPSRPDPGMEFERLLAQALERHAPVAAGARVLELGCAPAKWLGFYAERFGARVSGIEYTPHGAELSRRNLAALGVDGEIVEGDAFTVPATPADLVLSLGFIEHFPDLGAVFARHVEFLAPGGTLVIGVPNYTGLLGALQRLAGPAHLGMHNTAAMEPELYRRLAAEHGLAIGWQGYFGGPDPIIVAIERRPMLPLVYGLATLRRMRATARINRPWLSTYLLTVLRRPAR